MSETEDTPNQLVEILQEYIDTWRNKSSYGTENQRRTAEMCADDIEKAIETWQNSPDPLPEIKLTPGRHVIYKYDGEYTAGRIDDVDGKYVQLNQGVAVHMRDIIIGVFSDEVQYTLASETVD